MKAVPPQRISYDRDETDIIALRGGTESTTERNKVGTHNKVILYTYDSICLLSHTGTIHEVFIICGITVSCKRSATSQQ